MALGAQLVTAAPDELRLSRQCVQLGRVSSFTTKATLEMLKRRAYASAKFEFLAARSLFGTCAISTRGIGLEVRLDKPVA
jgi:hypothetical protein